MSTPDPRAAGQHPDELDLAALSLGEGSRDVDEATRTHVASCSVCADEVASLREVLELLEDSRGETFTAPPATVWEAVAREIGREDDGRTAPELPPGPTAGQDATPPVQLAPRRRQVPTWWVAAAASVALAAGIGIGTQLVAAPDESAPTAQVVGSTSLASLDDEPLSRGTAEVRQHDDQVSLHVEASELGGPAGTREVWLINLDGTRMVSLGMLPSGESGDFAFPERLLEQGYRIVDVSFEPDDGDPTHSGKSLARGTIEG